MLFNRVLDKVKQESDTDMELNDEMLDDKHDASPNMATPRALQDPSQVFRNI